MSKLITGISRMSYSKKELNRTAQEIVKHNDNYDGYDISYSQLGLVGVLILKNESTGVNDRCTPVKITGE